jgi:DNA helicase-2/ATP-dependent DNA helicase PcrA
MPPYTILIRDAVKTFLLSRSATEREKFKQQFDKLGTGTFPDSLQVKRNSGSITVLEGQLPNNIHIILTLGKQADDEQRRLIYVWKLTDAPKDDDDPSFLKNRPNSGSFTNNLTQVNESDYHSEDQIARECEPQRWYELNDENWKRILTGRPELKLWLDRDEKNALEKPLPVLLSGTAGSGKTTVSVYLLLEKYRESLRSKHPLKLLYVTYSEGLKEYAMDLFEGLLFEDEAKEEEKVANLFRTYRELCLELLKNHPELDKFQDERREMTLPGCYRRLQGKAKKLRADPTLIWEEIRSIIKGSKASAQFQDGLLPLKSQGGIKGYEDLGSREAPLFTNQRQEIYEIAEWYQREVIRGEGYWDEIDLAREAYRAVESDQRVEKYDLIVCDEAQDLTELQIALLFLLCENSNNLFFTGDEHQIINPSGFRWGDIRTAFWEQRRGGAPDISYLTWNHRSAGKIVELSNALLRLKRTLLPHRRHVPDQKARWGGEAPYVICGVEDKAVLSAIVPGADRAVLVRTEEQRRDLRERLGIKQVFTIHEAKGREWETILLWKFFDGDDTIETWRKILLAWKQPKQLNQLNLSEATIDHEISLLHVCLTRARRRLFIYDGNELSQLWKDATFLEYIRVTDTIDDEFKQAWQRESTPEEWWEYGSRLFRDRLYEQAAEAFEKAGDSSFQHEALARQYEKLKQWPEAAQNWEIAGQSLLEMLKDSAGKHYEIPFTFKRFSPQVKSLLDGVAKSFADRYRNAAECWEYAKQYREAQRCWLWAGEDTEALRCEIEALRQEAEALKHQGKDGE